PRVSFALLTPHRGYYMPPRHAARLLNSACRAGRQARQKQKSPSGGERTQAGGGANDGERRPC
ncbi:MAG: hypothetical protein IJN29_11160, partial [Akkermansia sp.]|nr:hypothetical protein [Akkermansia sp.]